MAYPSLNNDLNFCKNQNQRRWNWTIKKTEKHDLENTFLSLKIDNDY